MTDDFQKWIPPELPANAPIHVGVDKANDKDKTAVQVRKGTKMIRTFDPGDDVVGLLEHKGRIIVATKRAIYEYNQDTETWDQMVFRHILPEPIVVKDDALMRGQDD